MEDIFELLIRLALEMLGEIFKEIIIGIQEILGGVAEKINLSISFTSSVEIIELKLFD